MYLYIFLIWWFCIKLFTKHSLIKLFYYFGYNLKMLYHNFSSLLGIFMILIMVNQVVSGMMLSISYIPESMYINNSRNEEDMELLYMSTFLWLHERGVDFLYILIWLHILRKMYIKAFDVNHEIAWKSGMLTFFLLHFATFSGLVLSCNHLSDLTLLIAINLYHTLLFNVGLTYWWLFTDIKLNTDTLVRVSYIHYISGFFVLLLAINHVYNMHFDWKVEKKLDGINYELLWYDSGLVSEIKSLFSFIFYSNIIIFLFLPEIPSLAYEFFTWGDTGFIRDIRFYSVAPHWYFRAYMSWLVICPHNWSAIFGLIYFFLCLYFQPNIMGSNHLKNLINNNLYVDYYYNHTEYNIIYILQFYLFFCCLLYTTSYLPYGKYYYNIGGNVMLMYCFMYIYLFVGFKYFRNISFIFNSYFFIKYLYLILNLFEKFNKRM